MIFSRILFHALEKELGLKKLIFTDYFGLTPKTTKSYFDKGIKPGRMLNQLINRLSGIENSKKPSIAKYFAREFLKFFRPHSDKHRIPNEPDPNGIIDSHCFGVIDACRVVGEKPEEYLSQPPPYFYMLNFIESVQLPLRTGLFDITRENFDSLSFPYNKLDKNDAEKYFDVVALDERPAPCNAGPELHRLLIESFAGVVAAVSLDTERLAGGNLKGDPGFLKEAWEKDNIVADFFIWLRENHDSKTHKQFYSCLVPFFNIEPESVETNYKRWCETGILERKQLLNISNALRDQQDYDLIFLLQYFGVAILQTMKDVLKDCEIEYGYESFNNDVKKWKSWIKAEYPLESWQPSLAASGAITL